MRRFLSQSRNSRSSGIVPPQEKDNEKKPLNEASSNGSAETEVAPQPAAPLSPPNLKVKRVDYYWSTWSKAWKYRNTGSSVVAEAVRPVGNGTDNDPWQSFCFVVVRKMPDTRSLLPGQPIPDPTFQVVVKSPYLLTACKDVIGSVPGLSWTAEPLELDPQLLIAFFPQFETYERTLNEKGEKRTPEEEHVLSTLGVLLEYLRKDYRATLARIANLTTHGEITFDLLYAILLPRTVVVAECPTTGEPRALRLLSATKVEGAFCSMYSLLCESVDSMEESASPGRTASEGTRTSAGTRRRARGTRRATTQSTAGMKLPNARGGKRSFGKVQSKILIPLFSGTLKINSLEVYPIEYHSDPESLRADLIERGKKWASLRGIHHVHYEGMAARTVSTPMGNKSLKYNVDSRIMVDRGNFIRLNPNYTLPKATANNNIQQNPFFDQNGQMMDETANVPTLEIRTKHQEEEAPLTDEELLLASPILYGFSLSDKIWFEFNVEFISPIEWNDEAFAGLVLAADRKSLLRSLVDAHSSDVGFDDFVQGKGQGLIINLFGPPGVGKTLSAEATSEHVRRPLYVVGGGDLGTKASDLDQELERVFDIATSWKAIVLIDEADVFLERRSLHDLERNAMVAVFLRHVEYYRGILFLTTNRITAFDEAFLSRIHVALHFRELAPPARAQVWRAFLRKAGVAEAEAEAVIPGLASRAVNGRQIKNACRTAQSLALSRGEPLALPHLTETLDAMEEFTAEFTSLGKIHRDEE